MSCLKSTIHSSDSVQAPQIPAVIETNIETNEEYTELVQKSYEDLFEPWLNSSEENRPSDENQAEDGNCQEQPDRATA
jgi:hypothetical protein